MKEYLSLKKGERERIIKQIKQTLLNEKGVVFAYVFGSFLNAPSFRDVDIGVYLESAAEVNVFDDELKLSEKISKNCGLSFDIIDVKILNFAPDHFLNNIFCAGQLLFSKDETLLTGMIEKTSIASMDNEFLARESLKDLLPA